MSASVGVYSLLVSLATQRNRSEDTFSQPSSAVR